MKTSSGNKYRGVRAVPFGLEPMLSETGGDILEFLEIAGFAEERISAGRITLLEDGDGDVASDDDAVQTLKPSLGPNPAKQIAAIAIGKFNVNDQN